MAKEGEDWRQVFPSFIEAMAHAQHLRDAAVPLVVFNVWGEVLFTFERYAYM